MRLNLKRRLAVNCMVELALREHAGPVALSVIASHQQVSVSCLEQLFARLRNAGLVHSTRGGGGGYTLGRAAAAISVAAIVVAAEAGAKGTDESGVLQSPVGDLSRKLDAVMHKHMATIALADLMARQPAAVAVVEVHARPEGRAARQNSGFRLRA